MTHPEDLLAEYVDGTLGPDDRAGVDAHLSGCASCRAEVAAAQTAREAVASLPAVEPPAGLELAVRRQVRGTGRAANLAVRVGGTAAAAAIVGVLVWVGLSGGPDRAATDSAGQSEAPAAEPSDDTTMESDAAGDGGGADAPEALTAADRAASYPLVVESSTRYDPDSLADRAPRLAAQARDAIEAGFPPTARDFYSSFELRDLSPRAGTAISCVTGTVAPEGSVSPFIIELARFEEKEAYLAVFLQGPDADSPYDRITIVAVSRDGCDPLHYAFQLL
jgi:hypothetical protein